MGCKMVALLEPSQNPCHLEFGAWLGVVLAVHLDNDASLYQKTEKKQRK